MLHGYKIYTQFKDGEGIYMDIMVRERTGDGNGLIETRNMLIVLN